MDRGSWLSKGLFAGFVAALSLSAAMTAMRAGGLPIHLEMLIGALVTGGVGPSAWLLGLGLFLSAGALLGGLYGLACRPWLRGGSVVAGLILGLPHTAIAGVLLSWLSLPQGVTMGSLCAPGPFLCAAGPAGVVTFVGLHLAFGALVGWLVGRGACRGGSLASREARPGH